MSTSLKLTAKSQVTFKKDILRHLNVAPGDYIDVQKLPNGTVSIAPKKRTGKISDVFGMLKAPAGMHITIEQMSGAYAAEQGAWQDD